MKWMHTSLIRAPAAGRARIGVAIGVALLAAVGGAVAGGGVETSASNEAEMKTAAKRADLCTAANAVGIGLRGEYFAREDLDGAPLVTRIDRIVDFDSQFDWPTDKPAKPKSVRWSGWVRVPVPGAYQFHCGVPSMRVTVAGRAMCGEGVSPGVAADLAVGRYYPVSVEIRRMPPWAQSQRARFEWTAPHGARYVVPRPLLNPPNETVAKSPK